MQNVWRWKKVHCRGRVSDTILHLCACLANLAVSWLELYESTGLKLKILLVKHHNKLNRNKSVDKADPFLCSHWRLRTIFSTFISTQVHMQKCQRSLLCHLCHTVETSLTKEGWKVWHSLQKRSCFHLSVSWQLSELVLHQQSHLFGPDPLLPLKW